MTAAPTFRARRAAQDPVQVANDLALDYTSRNCASVKKANGQYFTPPEIARYMASLCGVGGEQVRILDPGAGTGTLSCALAFELSDRKPRPKMIRITAYETDVELAPMLARSYDVLARRLARRSVDVQTSVIVKDFVLDVSDHLTAPPPFDVAIMNPPYFKIRKDDPRALAMPMVCHGQPNIYSLFMALCALLLREGGELISITPRSFASGEYFRVFRRFFFDLMLPETIHLLESRQDAFRHDAVLQESIIARFVKLRLRERPRPVAIRSSNGVADIATGRATLVSLATIVDLTSDARILRLPTNNEQHKALAELGSFGSTLRTLGFDVSTGRVVAFRCTKYLYDLPRVSQSHVPLLWLQHVTSHGVIWPLTQPGKPQSFVKEPASMSLLIPNDDYVLVRRFSAKEDPQRIVAAPLARGALGSQWIAVENHLNVVRIPEECQTDRWLVTQALADYLNSTEVDSYVRALNGNTQIGAAELLSLPCPDINDLKQRFLGHGTGRNQKTASPVRHVPGLCVQ
jgi:adenine-specific DNA-methyltransferase